MPSSTTASLCVGRKRSRVSGTPMSLFKLPCVASAASDAATRNMLATICVTVVLPLLPVTAMSGKANCLRHALARCCKAWWVSLTSSPLQPIACRCAGWHSAAAAPAARACSKKLLASKRSPRKATNKSPACRVRVSVCTRLIASAPSPTKVACVFCSSNSASCAKVLMGCWFMVVALSWRCSQRHLCVLAGQGARAAGR